MPEQDPIDFGPAFFCGNQDCRKTFIHRGFGQHFEEMKVTVDVFTDPFLLLYLKTASDCSSSIRKVLCILCGGQELRCVPDFLTQKSCCFRHASVDQRTKDLEKDRMNEKKKLAVIFPGIGYTADKPLLYYARRIAMEQGYEVMTIAYSGFPKKIKGDQKLMEESFRIALDRSRQCLQDVDLLEYDDILFIGKSIGTIAAAKIASDNPAKEKIRLILYTPLEVTFSFSFGKAIAFTGTDDPWVGNEKSPVFGICEEKGIPCTLISYANHSLESKDCFQDMKELYRVMRETERFIQER